HGTGRGAVRGYAPGPATVGRGRVQAHRREGRGTARAWRVGGRSGIEEDAVPTRGRTGEEFALMEPIGPVGPELDAIGDEPEPGPEVRAGDRLVREPLLDLRDTGEKVLVRRKRPALLGSPGADLAPARPRGEVGVRLLRRNRLNRPLDAYLHLERLPMEAKRRVRVRRDFEGLSALQVGVEDEAAFVGTLQQHHAYGGPSLPVGSGECHRGRFGDGALLRLLEEGEEAGDRIAHGFGFVHDGCNGKGYENT